ncbi:unnamed protein product [Mycena citricolor]|uniref:Uncharacterized protein n=1 Tax=Mycena citricolor TaxID=2018698 RepID=A0AAD2JYK8_9AGAR|nr:unnamed protein product [Mycena citricolor]
MKLFAVVFTAFAAFTAVSAASVDVSKGNSLAAAPPTKPAALQCTGVAPGLLGVNQHMAAANQILDSLKKSATGGNKALAASVMGAAAPTPADVISTLTDAITLATNAAISIVNIVTGLTFTLVGAAANVLNPLLTSVKALLGLATTLVATLPGLIVTILTSLAGL